MEQNRKSKVMCTWSTNLWQTNQEYTRGKNHYNSVGKTGHMRKNEIGLLSYTRIKINPKWIKDFTVRPNLKS